MHYTIPEQEILQQLCDGLPEYMYPHTIPEAVVYPGFITPEECETMVQITSLQEPYRFHGCNAITRQPPRPLHRSFTLTQMVLAVTNDKYWQFNYDMKSAAVWMQTYFADNNYHQHSDGGPGQTRKLTAVVLLSDPEAYTGGDLKIFVGSNEYVVNRAQGTIVIFPAWVRHSVSPVKWGCRQTINLGVFGPSWK